MSKFDLLRTAGQVTDCPCPAEWSVIVDLFTLEDDDKLMNKSTSYSCGKVTSIFFSRKKDGYRMGNWS